MLSGGGAFEPVAIYVAARCGALDWRAALSAQNDDHAAQKDARWCRNGIRLFGCHLQSTRLRLRRGYPKASRHPARSQRATIAAMRRQ